MKLAEELLEDLDELSFSASVADYIKAMLLQWDGLSEVVKLTGVSYCNADKSLAMEFEDDEGETILIVFLEIDSIPSVVIVGEEDEDDEVIDLTDIGLKSFDFENEQIDNWLTLPLLLDILDGDEDYEDDEFEEAFINVIRGGKRIKKKLKRKKRKIMTSKKRAGIRKATRSRKRGLKKALRKRKRSLKIRGRMKLKRKSNPKMRV